MLRRKILWVIAGVFLGLPVSVVALAMPRAAHAGGVNLSIGIGIPLPVYVAPPPAVVYPAPVIVQPSPGIIYPPPVVYTTPYAVYGRPMPPDYGKKHHHHHRRDRYHSAHGHKYYKPERHWR